jgi:hypothetical protein
MPLPKFKILLAMVYATSLLQSQNQMVVASGQKDNCIPNQNWLWAQGDQQPDIAQRIESQLHTKGISGTVKAVAFGETDGCGQFKQHSTDIYIQLSRANTGKSSDQANQIQSLLIDLGRYARFHLDRVTLTYPDGSIHRLSTQATGSLVDDSQSQQLTWKKLSLNKSPSGRYIHGFAYDSDRHVSVLFGGDDTGSARLNDTWEFDGTSWVQVNTPQSPTGRANIDQTLVYDSNRKRTVLFGGLSNNAYLSDTWEYNGTTWQPVIGAITPAPRDSHAMAFDSNRAVAVLFGGNGYGSVNPRLGDTWEYDGQWRQKNLSQSPPARNHHSMAYDSKRHVVVLYGGSSGLNMQLNDTWEYDGINWRLVTVAQSPPARENHSMAYDGARGVIVMFGGERGGQRFNDTWEYDGTTWREVNVQTKPDSRIEMSLVYDSHISKTVFFGGGWWGTTFTPFQETWVYPGDAAPVPNALFYRKVFVIAYNPLLRNGQTLSEKLNWNRHRDITQQTIDLFRKASKNSVQFVVVATDVVTDGWPELTDGFRHTEDTYPPLNPGAPYHAGTVDYNRIVNSARFDICGKANRNEIDEVWIYNGPDFGFWESTLVGPDAYFYNSSPVPLPHNCQRLIPIMGPSPERTFDLAVHNFGHRTESTMQQVYGSWVSNRIAHNWERFALVKSKSPNFDYSGCGDTHFPPNATSDYDYGNTATINSNCDDFLNYPNLSDPASVVKNTTCSLWNCDQAGYFDYWFSHLPAATKCGSNGKGNNWLRYMIDPDLANHPEQACQAFLTISFTSGKPGSSFTVTGGNFPPNSPAIIKINGYQMGFSPTTDALGNLFFILTTSGATVGNYSIEVLVNPTLTVLHKATTSESTANISLALDSALPLRSAFGSGDIVNLSDVPVLRPSAYLPLIIK